MSDVGESDLEGWLSALISFYFCFVFLLCFFFGTSDTEYADDVFAGCMYELTLR